MLAGSALFHWIRDKHLLYNEIDTDETEEGKTATWEFRLCKKNVC